MSWQEIVFGLVLVVLLVATVPPLGRYMADVYGAREDGTAPGDRFFNPIERWIYRVCGIDHKRVFPIHGILVNAPGPRQYNRTSAGHGF